MSIERVILRNQNDGGGSFITRNPIENEPNGPGGSLSEFLQKDFLGKAAEAGVLSGENATEIPVLVNDVLASLFPLEGEPRMFADLVAISSVPRSIAWKSITGSVYDGSWEYYRYLKDKGEILARSDDARLRNFAESFSEISVDLDVKVTGMSDASSLVGLGDRIAGIFGIPQETIQRNVADGRQTIDYTFTSGRYFIDVHAGQSPTSPKRMRLSAESTIVSSTSRGDHASTRRAFSLLMTGVRPS